MTRNPIRRSGLVLLSLLLPFSPIRAEEPALHDLLRDALYTEEVARDPEKAAKQYEELLARHAEQKQFAASALFRLAEVRRKQNRKDDAIRLYQRLLAEFPGAETETKLAQENLAALGGKMPEETLPVEDTETRSIRDLQKQFSSNPDLVRSPIHMELALQNNHPRTLGFLLDSGASPTDTNGNPILLAAARNGYLQMVSVLLAKEKEQVMPHAAPALAQAAWEGQIDVIRALLAAGADPNWQPETCALPEDVYQNLGNLNFVGTPLMTAILRNNKPLIDILLEAKADVKMPANGTGLTALHLAAASKEPYAKGLIESLINHGADVNALTLQDELRSPPQMRRPQVLPVRAISLSIAPKSLSSLQYAVDRESWDGAKALIRHGANLKQPGLFDSWLGSESDGKAVAKIRFLLENGADPNIPSGTVKLERTKGHGDPFAETSGKQEEYPCPPVYRVTFSDGQSGNSLEVIRLLLAAGAKPGPTLGYLLGSVAKRDEEGSIVRSLLALRPQAVNLQELPYLSEWKPVPRRIFSEEIVIPALAKKPGVSLLYEAGWWKSMAEGGPDNPIPATLDLFRVNQDHLLAPSNRTRDGDRQWMNLVLARMDSAGHLTREPINLAGDAPLPVLRDGDIIEHRHEGDVTQTDQERSEMPKRFLWYLDKRVSFPITVEINGAAREIMLRGDLLSFDPTKNEAPLLTAGPLAALFLPDEAERPETLLVKREGWNDIRLTLKNDGAKGFRLEAGDRLVMQRMKPQETRDVFIGPRPIRLISPGFSFARNYRLSSTQASASPETVRESVFPPTLAQIITDAYCLDSDWMEKWKEVLPRENDALFPWLHEQQRWFLGAVPVVLPHPDLSNIRIRRVDKDGGESVIKVDLAQAVRGCSDETSPADAHDSDVELLPGDVVELPLKTDRLKEPWSGFSPEETRFFRKALGGRILIDGGGGRIEQKEIRYHPPEWRVTPHGLLPLPPQEGIATTRIGALEGFGAKLTLTRGGNGPFEVSQDTFMRNGDQFTYSENQRRQPRPRVVPPPSR